MSGLPCYIKVKGKYYGITKDSKEIKDIDVAYIFGENGIFYHQKTKAFEIIKKSAVILDIDTIEEKSTYKYPAISFDIYSEALTFLRAVFKEYKSEGCVLLTLNRNEKLEEQEYKIIIPKQEVGGASVDYKDGLENLYKELSPGEFLAGSIHSHPDFGAHQSGTDLSDEQDFDGPHITLGNIMKAVPSIHARICLGGDSFDVSMDNLSDVLNIIPDIKIESTKKDWIEKVSKKVYITTYCFEENNTRNRAGFHQQPFLWEDSAKTHIVSIFKQLKPNAPLNQRNANKLQHIKPI